MKQCMRAVDLFLTQKRGRLRRNVSVRDGKTTFYLEILFPTFYHFQLFERFKNRANDDDGFDDENNDDDDDDEDGDDDDYDGEDDDKDDDSTSDDVDDRDRRLSWLVYLWLS